MVDYEASATDQQAAAARAAEQARLRKERREAKIKAGGTSRLDRITGLSGGLPRGAYMSRGGEAVRVPWCQGGC